MPGLGKKKVGRRYIFLLSFLQVAFPPLHPHWIFPVARLCLAPWFWAGACTPSFTLCPPSLVCAVHDAGPTFSLCKVNKNCEQNDGSFSSKICFKYTHTYRGLCFRLVYTSPGSCFSEGGSEGFDEAQLCRNKIGIPSHAALSIFSQYLAQTESVQCVITVLWMDHLKFLLQVKNKSAKKGRGTWMGQSHSTYYHSKQAIYFQVQIISLLIYDIPLAVHQLLCRGALHFASTMEGA